MMLIEGFRVTRSGDNSYKVTDARQIVIGHVVRHIDFTGAKKFRAFGEDFETLGAAVAEHGKIPNARKFDDKGDAEEPKHKVLR